jgi:hypothetical protein
MMRIETTESTRATVELHRPLPREERAHGLVEDVGGQQEEGCCHQVKRPAFGGSVLLYARVRPRLAQPPQQGDGRDHLDA